MRLNMSRFIKMTCAVTLCLLARGGTIVQAADTDHDGQGTCNQLPSHDSLRAALVAAQSQPNGGFGLNMWATVVNRDGVVCAVAFTGNSRGEQWPGSRVISAQKANTANAFSLPKLALSTADLYSATQPGGTLFGLQESNPVSTKVAYGGDPDNNGQSERSDDWRTDWRYQCVWRWAGALQLKRPATWRAWGERRLVVRRPQYCVAGAECSEAGLCSGRSWT